MNIHLPNSGFLGNIDPFIRSFNPENPSELVITANEKWISVHPVIITMLGSLGNKAKKVVWKNKTATSIHYFQRIGLADKLGINLPKIIEEHEATGKFIPLTIVKSAEEQSHFINDMIPLLHLSYEQAEPIKYVISELLRNVIEHAQSKDGAYVCAQFYPKSKIVRLGITDAGIGIKKSMNNNYSLATDIEAIRYALIPGVSGSLEPDLNAGAGLFFTKTIAKVNKDFFMAYSGNAMYKLLKPTKETKKTKFFADPFKDRHTKKDDMPYWQGTVIGIDISTDNTHTFTDLMQEMRVLYTKKLKEKKEIIKVRPRFT